MKLILDKLVESKKEELLAPLPAKDDRFLRNMLKLTHEFHDLVAGFLSDFGLDAVDDKVMGKHTQLQVSSGMLFLSL